MVTDKMRCHHVCKAFSPCLDIDADFSGACAVDDSAALREETQMDVEAPAAADTPAQNGHLHQEDSTTHEAANAAPQPMAV